MQTLIRCRAMLVLCFVSSSVACGVGGIGQTTASPVVQPASSTQQEASTQTGNTTGAVDPVTTTTGGTGSTTANTTTTTGDTTAGTTTGTTAGSTTGTTTGTTTGQNGNTSLFDLSTVNQGVCLYDTSKRTFALTMSNDAQYCAHGAAGIRINQDHELVVTGKLPKETTTIATADPNNPNGVSDPNTTVVQPTEVQATLSLYSSTCTLQSQATSLSASVTLTQASSSSCSGTFTLLLKQTQPTISGTPVTLNGSFGNAQACATLGTTPPPTTCQ